MEAPLKALSTTAPSNTAPSNTAQPQLPPGVVTLDLPGKQVHVVGTAHVSARSVEDVRQAIAAARPDAVCVELCEPRRQALTRGDAWRELDLFQVIRRRQAGLLLVHLVLAAFQRKLGEKLGVRPGADMLAALESGQAAGAQVVLADRNIQITLRRTWASLRAWDRVKLLGELLLLVAASPEIREQDIEALKQQDLLGQVLEQFARAFPRAKAALIDERDRVLAHHIRSAPGPVVVAVVGAGHVEGVLRALRLPPEDIAPLLTVPPRGRLQAGLRWAIPALVLGLLGWGFWGHSPQASWEMARAWILVKGSLAALGAALAFSHPLTILTAFAVAPFTALLGVVPSGWVAGLTEVLLRKPKVRDFEALATDLTSVRGFWRNRVTRILLVVALTNLGGMLGTAIGIPLLSTYLR